MINFIDFLPLLGLIWLVFWLYPTMRVEWFRDQMLALRDEMFLDAAKGYLDFDDAAYGMLRSTMNGLIRFGDRISFIQLLLMVIFTKPTGDGFAQKLQKHLENLPSEKRDKLTRYRDRMDSLLIWHVLWLEPVFGILLISFVFVLTMILTVKARMSSWMSFLMGERQRLGIDRLDDVAYSFSTG